MAKRIFNCVLLLLLLALFIFPSRYLTRLSDDIVERCELSVDAVIRKDWEYALTASQEINVLITHNKEKMHLFLNHEMIEDMDASARSCLQLILVKDQAQCLQELEYIITRARYLKSIEEFSLNTLL